VAIFVGLRLISHSAGRICCPRFFKKIVDEVSEEAGSNLDDFQLYLRRHVELDGDEHGPMAARLIESLCGADESKWRSAEEAAVAALRSRLALWDGIHNAIKSVAAGRVGHPSRRLVGMFVEGRSLNRLCVIGKLQPEQPSSRHTSCTSPR